MVTDFARSVISPDTRSRGARERVSRGSIAVANVTRLVVPSRVRLFTVARRVCRSLRRTGSRRVACVLHPIPACYRRVRPRWATLATCVLNPDDLALLAETEEIRIETARPDGPPHRTIIWVVVDGDDAFVRSVNGAEARWYREAVANPSVTIHAGGRQLRARAVAGDRPESVQRTSDALSRKYAGVPGSARCSSPTSSTRPSGSHRPEPDAGARRADWSPPHDVLR